MTEAQVEKWRLGMVSAWAARANTVIGDRTEDARGHAWNALTLDVARADGNRRAWRLATATRSYSAAQLRLDELLSRLAGPRRGSLKGLLRDARQSFYAEAFRVLGPTIPPEIASDRGPTKAGEDAARGLVLHGLDLRDEIGAVVDKCSRDLSSAVLAAGPQSVSDRAAAAILADWRAKAEDRLRKAVLTALSDSEVAIFNLVGRDLIDERFHAED